MSETTIPSMTTAQLWHQFLQERGYGQQSEHFWYHVEFANYVASSVNAVLRETNRELNRRNQALQHSLNQESGRKSWHGYFRAALSLFGKADDDRKKAEADRTRLQEALKICDLAIFGDSDAPTLDEAKRAIRAALAPEENME